MTPTLTSAHLVMHQQTPDYRLLAEWLNDPDTMKYSEQRHREHTFVSCRQYIRSFNHESSHIWSIYNLDKEFVGTITAYRDPFNKIADMGVLIGKPYWQREYGREAWKAVMDWLFETDQDIRKIEAGCMAINIAMQKIFDKTGMKLEGERKNHFLWNNQMVSLLQYAKFK